MEINETVDKDIRTIIADVLYRSQYAKNEMCLIEPMSDNPPMILIGYKSDESNPDHEVAEDARQELGLSQAFHVPMLPLIHKPDIYDCFEDIVRAMPVDRFEFMVMVTEGYCRAIEDKAGTHLDPNDFHKGELEQDYKENPFSDVREAIIITAVDWDSAGLWNTTCTYRYDDVGSPIWDEPIHNFTEFSGNDDEPMGRMPEALFGAVKYMHLATQTLAYKELLDKAGKDRRKKGE
jgi:hypothetical protein